MKFAMEHFEMRPVPLWGPCTDLLRKSAKHNSENTFTRLMIMGVQSSRGIVYMSLVSQEGVPCMYPKVTPKKVSLLGMDQRGSAHSMIGHSHFKKNRIEHFKSYHGE
jgi:hypothetical protein